MLSLLLWWPSARHYSPQRHRDHRDYTEKLKLEHSLAFCQSAQLAADQARLAELEGRLDMLEREIENEVERQRAEDRSQQGKKRP